MTAVQIAPPRDSSPFRPFTTNQQLALPIRPPPIKPSALTQPTLSHAPVPKSSSAGCPHIDQALLASDVVLDRYVLAVRWGRKRESNALRKKPVSGRCATCHRAPPRPAVCLECGDIFCPTGHHARRHLESSNHRFFIDTRKGAVFCHSCDEYIYNAKLCAAAMGSNSGSKPHRLAGCKRERTHFKPWRANAESKVTIAQTAKVRPCDNMRGIRNLGATCFLNVILQALLHNPLVRGYFLADRHNASTCPITSRHHSGVCMMCEVDRIFTAVYTGPAKAAPYAPIHLLQASWLMFRDLAGYSQQDAHEYMIATLNAMHGATPGSNDGTDCHCVVHTTFAGELRSDVRCGRCGKTTTALDPMLDLSLDIRSANAHTGVAGAEEASTLFSCLDRYTSSEKLGAKQYSCNRCGTGITDATKKLSINRLPPVLCIQLKRFEHAASSRKIDTRVRFPLQLDMAPYTTDRNATDATYDLFAVVTHEGKLDTGHYYVHVRQRDNWTLINDDVLTPASLRDVLQTNPYLLFYVRTSLDYAKCIPHAISHPESP